MLPVSAWCPLFGRHHHWGKNQGRFKSGLWWQSLANNTQVSGRKPQQIQGHVLWVVTKVYSHDPQGFRSLHGLLKLLQSRKWSNLFLCVLGRWNRVRGIPVYDWKVPGCQLEYTSRYRWKESISKIVASSNWKEDWTGSQDVWIHERVSQIVAIGVYWPQDVATHCITKGKLLCNASQAHW